MEYVIGIDGGGTGSRLAVADRDGRVVWKTEGSSTNRYAVSEDEALGAYRDLFKRAFERIDPGLVGAVCIGSAGLARHVEKARLEEGLSEILPKRTRLRLVGDGELLLHGALPRAQGIALVSGTGSVCYGMDEEGRIVRSGGLGWRLGDEGSAWHMADEAVRATLRAEDGRGRCSAEVAKSVLGYFGVRVSSELIPVMNDRNLEKSYVAGFAPILSKLAGEGDATALGIVEAEVDELCILVRSCYERLFFGRNADLVLAGGVLEHDKFVRGMLLEALADRLPEARPMKAAGTALDGALRLAAMDLRTQMSNGI